MKILTDNANEAARWTVVALGFCIPLSTSATGALLAVLLILWLLGGNFKKACNIIKNNRVAMSAVIMTCLFLIGLLYGDLNQDSLSHALRFLLVPIMMPFFIAQETRRYAMYGFLSAMFITLILSYFAWFGLLPPNDILRKASSPYFVSSEFSKDKKIEVLCENIHADTGAVPFMKSEKKTLSRLNEFLELPDLFDRLHPKQKELRYSQEIMDLVNATNEFRRGYLFSDINERKREKIKQLNRLMLEERYPAITPKSSKVHNVDTAVIQNKITHNFLMAFAVFMLAIYFRDTDSTGKKVLFLLLGGLAIFNVMFVVGGKTGQVVIIALMVYFLLSCLNIKKGLIVSFVIMILFAIFIYSFPSNLLSDSVSRSINQFSDWRPDKADFSSVGQRLEFYYNSLRIIFENPVAGVGTGDFAAAYAEKVRGTPLERTDNPHNEYLLTAVQMGIAGFFALMYLFYSQWRCAVYIRDPSERTMARGLVIAVAVGCLFNSLLTDYTEGLFFFWMSAMLFTLHNSANKDNAIIERLE